MLNEGVSTEPKTIADSLISEGKIFIKEPWNTLLKHILPTVGNTDLTNKILDQVAVREIIITNTTEVCIKVNYQPITEAETINEHQVVKNNNSKVIDNVVEFKSNGHMRTTTLFDEGVSTANQMLGKKIMRNEKENTSNAIDNEIIKKRNPKPGTKFYHNID